MAASQPATFNVQEFTDAGLPLAGGMLYTYAQGTTTLKIAYTDPAGTIPHTYTSDGAGGQYIALNARGELPAPLYLASGAYDLTLKRADGSTVWTRRADGASSVNDLSGATGASFVGYGSSTLDALLKNQLNAVVPSIANLRGLDKSKYTQSCVTGYYAAGDGGGGIYYYDSSDTTSVDNGGTIIIASDGGRWKLQAIGGELKAKQFGIKGDGTTDDWAAFSAACAAAVAAKLPLDIRGLKIYLGTQNASIESHGLTLIGSGQPKPQVNWSYMAGDAAQFSTVVSSILTQIGSAIISRYNGAIFKGKTLSGDNFIVMGDPSKSNSIGYDTGTPTAYPGWTQPFANLSRFTAYYTGSDGIRCQGGLEVATLRDIAAHYCGGRCLHVYQTAGVNSPIEYLSTEGNCAFTYGLLGNVRLNGARKQITLHNVMLNDPGQLSRTASGGLVVSSEAGIIYPVEIIKDSSVTVLQNVEVSRCYAEYSQGIVNITGGLASDVRVLENFLIPYNVSWPYYHAKFDTQVLNLRTDGNRSNSVTKFYFTPGQHAASAALYLAEKYDDSTGYTQHGYALLESQIRPGLVRPVDSGMLGNGSAGTFTFDIANACAFASLPFNQASRFATFLVTANFQSSAIDNIGAYLVHVTLLNSGHYVAIVQSTGVTAGFSGAPTVSTAGVLSVPLSDFYRARVTRLDINALS